METIEIKTACGSCCIPEQEISVEYKGQTLRFCEQECKEEFLEDPVKFLKSNHYALDIELTNE
ncbi:MAG: YHS domain-containing protein [Candidatus Kariarchaeaceae archaeon]|jgi:YHS domain-containing protein